MIMRVFQVTVHPGKEAEFSKFFHETAIPLMLSTPGLERLIPGAPRDSSPNSIFEMIVRHGSSRSFCSMKAT